MKIAKVFTVLLIIACIALGIHYLYKGQLLINPFLTENAHRKLISADLSNDALISKLSNNTIMVLRIEPRRFDVIQDSINHFFNLIAQTKLGKKNNATTNVVTTLIDKFFEGMLKGSNGDVEFINKLRATSYNSWKTLSLVDIVLVDQGKIKINDIVIPQVMISASFSDTLIVDNLFSYIDEKLPLGTEPYTHVDITLTRSGQREVSYEIVSEGQKITGTLSVQNNTLKLLFATKTEDSFYATSPQNSLLNRPNFNNVKTGALANQAALFYIDFSYLLPYYDKFIKLIPTKNESDLESKQLFDALISNAVRELKSILSSISFDAAISSRQCISVESKTNIEKYYTTLSAVNNRNDGSDINFYDLISDRTIFAIDLDSSTIEAEVDNYLSIFERIRKINMQDSKELEVNNAYQRISENIDRYRLAINKLGFKELALRVNSSSTGPFPEVVIFLGRSKLGGQEALKEMHTQILDIFDTLKLPETSKQKLILGKNKLGEPSLEINFSDAAKIVFEPIGNHSIIISGRIAMMVSPPENVLQKDEFFSKILIDGKPASQLLNASGVFAYINLKAFFEMMRSFIPMILASQNGQSDEKIEMKDIEEIFETFGVILLAQQRTLALPESTYCVDAWWRKSKHPE